MYQTQNIGVTKETGLLSIKEFSDISGVAPSALRYWEQQGVMFPAYRNQENGYRYYSSNQVEAVRLIQVMGVLDISLETMKDIGKCRSPEQILALYRDCNAQLEEKIAELRTKQDMLLHYASLVEESRAAQSNKIELCALPSQSFRRASTAQIGRSVSPARYAYNEFYDLLEVSDDPAQLVVFDPLGPERRPAGEYLVGTETCRYGEASGLPRRMLEYALQNGLEMHGPAYAAYLPDAASPMGTEDYLLQITIAVATDTDGI